MLCGELCLVGPTAAEEPRIERQLESIMQDKSWEGL